MYDIRPNLVIAFHGCDIRVRDKLLNHPNEIAISQKPYDWLGHGMYFWEYNYDRALSWAEDKKKRGAIEIPAVIGAVLYLGYCCDLTDTKFIHLLSDAYERMAKEGTNAKKELPKNRTDSQSTAHPLIKVGEGPMPAPESGVGKHPD